MLNKHVLFIALLAASFTAGAQDERTQVEPQVQATTELGRVLKRKVAIARFSNETQYGKGMFYDRENDPMAKQALDILSTKLAATGKFLLLERNDLDKITGEQGESTDYKKIGADYVIIGSITQYGRKNTGDAGVFSNAKTQTVEAAVSLRLIDVSTGQIIYSEEAKGYAETKSKTTLGIGGTADFDATLSDKAIAGAMTQLTENIINNCMDRPWKAYFLTVDEGTIYISGGKSQGIGEGDIFTVKEKGKSVKNPQTGMMMELPGKTIGKIEVTMTGGSGTSEFSIVEFTKGKIDESKLENYYIEES